MAVKNPLPEEIDLSPDANINAQIKDGKTELPPNHNVREGWAEAAAEIAALPLTEEEEDWLAFGNEADDELEW